MKRFGKRLPRGAVPHALAISGRALGFTTGEASFYHTFYERPADVSARTRARALSTKLSANAVRRKPGFLAFLTPASRDTETE